MAEPESPIQSYAIDKDDYVLREVASKTSKEAKVYTVTGVIVKKFGTAKPEDAGKFGGNTYKYYIWSHHKRRPNYILESTEDNQRQIKDNELIQDSLLYVTYSNKEYQESEKVIINKQGSFLEIVGTTNKFVPIEVAPVDDDVCRIKLKVEKRTVLFEVDTEGNKTEIKEIRPQSSSEYTQSPSVDGALSMEEEIRYIVESETNCTDSFMTSVDSSISGFDPRTLESPDDVNAYRGFDGPHHEKVVLARKLSKGKRHLGGLIYANFDLVLPISMEKDLKRMAKSYRSSTGNVLYVNSIFRTNAKQTELYNSFKSSSRDTEGGKANPAAKPGHSKHQSGTAIDFQITANDDRYKNKKNSDFKYSHSISSEENWPKVYQWLKRNAHKFNFSHPSGVNQESLFEGWHWVYNG